MAMYRRSERALRAVDYEAVVGLRSTRQRSTCRPDRQRLLGASRRRAAAVVRQASCAATSQRALRRRPLLERGRRRFKPKAVPVVTGCGTTPRCVARRAPFMTTCSTTDRRRLAAVGRHRGAVLCGPPVADPHADRRRRADRRGIRERTVPSRCSAGSRHERRRRRGDKGYDTAIVAPRQIGSRRRHTTSQRSTPPRLGSSVTDRTLEEFGWIKTIAEASA